MSNLPKRFTDYFGDQVFGHWLRAGKPPIINIVPLLPLSMMTPLSGDDVMPSATVTMVQLRCWTVDGVMFFEALTPTDAKVAQDWVDKREGRGR